MTDGDDKPGAPPTLLHQFGEAISQSPELVGQIASLSATVSPIKRPMNSPLTGTSPISKSPANTLEPLENFTPLDFA